MTSIVPPPSIESSILCDACFDQLSKSSSLIQDCVFCSLKSNSTCFNAHTTSHLGSLLTPGVETASNEFLAAVMNHDYIQWRDADRILVVSNSSACREAYSRLQKEIMSTMYRHCDTKTRATVLTAFAHFSSLTLSRPSESVSTSSISAPVSPCRPLSPLENNNTTDRTGLVKSHSCTEFEFASPAWKSCHAHARIDPEPATDDLTTSEEECAWRSPCDPCRFGLPANSPAPLPPPITVEHRDEPLHNIPKVTFSQVKTFGERFNDRFLSITGGRDMNDHAVRDAWRACNGFHRLRQLSRLIELIQGMPGDEPLSEAHASGFQALSADIDRLLRSISVTLKTSGRTLAAAIPLEESPCSQSLTPDSTVSTPFGESPSRGMKLKNATWHRISTRRSVPWPKELEEDQFSYGTHLAYFQPPAVADDFVPTYSKPRNPSAITHTKSPSKHEAHSSIAITDSMTTATDPNEVYQPTPPAGRSSRRGAISRPHTLSPIVPTTELEVPILHEKPAQVSKIASRRVRRLKSTNNMDEYSGSAQTPVVMTPQVPAPLIYDPTLFTSPAEVANPLRNQNGEIVRFYSSYMTVGGSQNGLIPYLSAGDVSVPGSLMLHHPHA